MTVKSDGIPLFVCFCIYRGNNDVVRSCVDIDVERLSEIEGVNKR
jgi:hypothetical protein